MRCYRCDKVMIWQSDFDFDDCCLEGEGIVAVFSCSGCDTIAEITMPETK